MSFFVEREYVANLFKDKTVAIVGSGPGVLGNAPGLVDSHDIVCRVNNYGLIDERTGFRCDVHYSFFGSSIKKTADELKHDGVKLVLCKCPDAKFLDSEWHRVHNKPFGVDFRYIYKMRSDFWFCPTYVPSLEEFVATFDLLHQHIPSTGFSGLLLISSMKPKSIFLTGMDFFASRTHNVNEPWRPGNPDDPIGHAPTLERAWLRENGGAILMDEALSKIMERER